MIRFVTWGYRQALPPQTLIDAIAEFAGGPVYAINVDTGTSDYVVALSDHPISVEKAFQAWQAT